MNIIKLIIPSSFIRISFESYDKFNIYY